MDLWGKYDISSIHGNQYYLLLVDDATRYVTLYFLKAKSEAGKHIKAYLTYLQVRGNPTHAIRVDRGTEFINKDLIDWCHEKGMELQLTAPYSPSQNGVAERMNHTLVELARAMLTVTSDIDLAPPKHSYVFCQMISPVVGHDGGPCTCYDVGK
jgi:transposase InsO family protein